MKWKKVLKWTGIVVAVLIVLRVGIAFIWPTINDVKTGATPEYAELQPQRFKLPQERVFAAVLATAQAAGWEIAAQDGGKGEIQAVATTMVFRFKDDITLTVTRDGDGTVVNMRSRSRVGLGDFGTNARRIAKFQAELARRITGA